MYKIKLRLTVDSKHENIKQMELKLYWHHARLKNSWNNVANKEPFKVIFGNNKVLFLNF